MKIIKNEKRINRNGRIGRWAILSALVILGTGMYLSVTNNTDPQMFTYSAVALIVGFVLMQIGIYMGNRYGRSPRPDEKLDTGLKGLQNDFALYHYSTPVSHLLLGPAGVWILLPYHQRGQATFKKNRWQMSGGGFAQAQVNACSRRKHRRSFVNRLPSGQLRPPGRRWQWRPARRRGRCCGRARRIARASR